MFDQMCGKPAFKSASLWRKKWIWPNDAEFRSIAWFVLAASLTLRPEPLCPRKLGAPGRFCFRGLFYEVSLALVGVASPA